METLRLTAAGEDAGLRLDAYLARAVEGLTRSAAQRLIEEGRVLCGGVVPAKSARLAGGEEIQVTLPEPKETQDETAGQLPAGTEG